MIWHAICTCGKQSVPFMTTGTINGRIYLKESLRKVLLSLMKQHETPRSSGRIQLSATIQVLMEWYEDNGDAFVPKIMNPPTHSN